MRPIFTGKVENGRLALDRKDRFLAELVKLSGKQVRLTIEPHRRVRSLNQNRYYWGVVVKILGEHFGYTEDEMHEALKWKFLRKGAEGPLVTVRSTASLDTADFEEFLEKVRTWAQNDCEVRIPLPNEVELEMDFAA